MSKYSKGEIAKQCGVSVRTVQYYDSRGIVVPSELSEGGRRLYSDENLRQMKIVCFLRKLDLPINSIKELLLEENSEEVLSILLSEHEKGLRDEMAEIQEQLGKLTDLRQSLKKIEHFSFQSIGDIAVIMENKKRLRKMRQRMIFVGIVMDIIEVGTLVFWIQRGIWQPFALGMCVVVALGVWISYYYFHNVSYICPKCHTVFRPTFRQAFLPGTLLTQES